jgi:hypothetical protein
MKKLCGIGTVCVSMIILLAGCLPDPLEVEDVPLPEEQVVVGSQLIPDQFITLTLTKNFTALEAGLDSDLEAVITDLLLTGVDPTIRVDGQDYPMVELLDGIYAVDDLPQEPGTLYTLSFINPINLDSTSAQALALPFIGFSSLDPVLDYTEFDSLLRVQFSIEDPPGPNWYMVNAQAVGMSIDLGRRPFTQLYTDEGSDGEVIEDQFTVLFRDFTEEDTVLISMANVSEEYFKFLELRGNQQFLLIEELGEPVNYPTNVRNGLGFFNVHLPDIRIYVLDDL